MDLSDEQRQALLAAHRSEVRWDKDAQTWVVPNGVHRRCVEGLCNRGLIRLSGQISKRGAAILKSSPGDANYE